MRTLLIPPTPDIDWGPAVVTDTSFAQFATDERQLYTPFHLSRLPRKGVQLLYRTI